MKHAPTTKRRTERRAWIAVLTAASLCLSVVSGCDYINPLSGGSQEGASGDIPKKKADQAQKDQQQDQQKESDDQQKDQQQDGVPDAGTDAGEDDQAELTVPEPSGEDDSKQPARNPFAPKVQGEETSEETTDEQEGPLEPLERHALSQLKLAAIISGVAVPKAMFIAPGGKGHLAQEGDRVGKEGGEIIDIRSNAVELSIPQGPDEPPLTKTVELAPRGVGTTTQASGELTEEERKMIDRLMKTKEGREALRERYQGSGQQQGQSPPSQGQSNGLRPPGSEQTQGNQ